MAQAGLTELASNDDIGGAPALQQGGAAVMVPGRPPRQVGTVSRASRQHTSPAGSPSHPV